MRWTKRISIVDVHAAGEVGRVITGGVLDIPGRTIAEKKRHLETEADDLRRFCLFEPRGSAAMSVNLLLPPTSAAADLGMIIMESTDYPAMSGSNLMCVCTAALELGIVPMTEPVTKLVVETPAGLLPVTAHCLDGKCQSVTLDNVPCFVEELDANIEVEGVGTVQADITFGGAFFAIVDAARLGFAMVPDEARELVDLGERIKSAASEQFTIVHPEMPDINSVTFTLFGGPPRGAENVRKSAVVISPGRLDRSPCGTGTCARLATLHHRGLIASGTPMIHESLIGTRFIAEVVAETEVAGRAAVVPRLTGQAWIFGTQELALDPSDPFPAGFTLTDTWGNGVRGLNSAP
ncbi:proline racemase [Arboricoccus pini]|uniref:Proline racemase n=1 Tax=Arboricoccus pini TaxID=1963835 RepID=A0A212PZW1_9PROT|nr:proline racemase family protein [Arboricoccus pini]SNB52631.1 proline racemase [Arboricoccus pini]